MISQAASSASLLVMVMRARRTPAAAGAKRTWKVVEAFLASVAGGCATIEKSPALAPEMEMRGAPENWRVRLPVLKMVKSRVEEPFATAVARNRVPSVLLTELSPEAMGVPLRPRRSISGAAAGVMVRA